MNKETSNRQQVDAFSAFWQRPVLQHLLLFFFSFLLYANTLNHDFTQDDAIVIYDNMFTTQGIEGIPGILENDTFYGFFKEEGKDKLVAGGRYRPFTQILFALEWEVFGNDPLIGHLMNVLYFSFLVLLLFQIIKLLFRPLMDERKTLIFGFVAALLFAAHPIHTEVVANIKGRDEIMSLFLSLSTFWLILKYIDEKKIVYLLFSVPLFLLALLSKENAITFVAVIPLALLLFRKINGRRHLTVLFSLLLSSFVFLAIRTSVLGLDFGGESMELMNNPFLKWTGTGYVGFSFGEKMATILFTLGKYIQLLIFPHPLTHDYYPRAIGIMNFGDWQVWLSLLMYLLLILFVVLRFHKNKIITFGILFYLITLSIVSNIVFPIGTNLSERFLFMPSVGFTLVLAYLFIRYSPRIPRVFNALLVLAVLLLSFKTFTRNQVWQDDYTLFTTDVEISTNSAKVNNAAGGAIVNKYSKEKNPAIQRRMMKQAIKYLDKAIAIHPSYKNPYLIKGNAQFYLKEYEAAISTYESVLAFAPTYEEAKKNLAIAHREAGKDAGMNNNDLTKALYHLDIATAMMPDDYESWRLSGIANALGGNYTKARDAFTKAVELAPENAGAYVNLGNVYYNMGDVDMGEFYHQKAVELDPQIFDQKNQQ
jgi:tetratricopeptide (TPR) repeat protein